MPTKTKRITPPFRPNANGRAIDPGIAHQVRTLFEAGIETFESCEGGPGHSFPVPTVRFFGDFSEGFRALAIALQRGLNPTELRRVWTVLDGAPVGPQWELTFPERTPYGGRKRLGRDGIYR